MKSEKFKLSDSYRVTLDMDSTAKTMTEDIRSLKGINNAAVDISDNSITIDYNENEISSDKLRNKLSNLNYLD